VKLSAPLRQWRLESSSHRTAGAIRLGFGATGVAISVYLVSTHVVNASLALLFVLVWATAIWLGGRWRTIVSLCRYRDARRIDRTRSWDGALVGGMSVALAFAVVSGTSFALLVAALAPGWCVIYSGGKAGCWLFGCCRGRRSAKPFGVGFPLTESIIAIAMGLTCWTMTLRELFLWSALMFLLGHALLRLLSAYIRRSRHWTFRVEAATWVCTSATCYLLLSC
jgi:hypothetical protein